VVMLGAVENLTDNMRQVAQGIDQKLVQVQVVTTEVSATSVKLSQNVTDQGLILLLLPEQQEQALVEAVSSVKDAVSSLKDKLATGLAFYRSIDQLPFISLPGPTQDQVDNLASSIVDVQTTVDGLKSDVTTFRSGAMDKIGKVTTGADQLTTQLGQARDRLAKLDTRLAAAQKGLVRLKQAVVTALMLAALLATIMLAWVIYSQVEVLRLYTQCWKGLGKEIGSQDNPGQPAGDAGEQDTESTIPPEPENPA